MVFACKPVSERLVDILHSMRKFGPKTLTNWAKIPFPSHRSRFVPSWAAVKISLASAVKKAVFDANLLASGTMLRKMGVSIQHQPVRNMRFYSSTYSGRETTSDSLRAISARREASSRSAKFNVCTASLMLNSHQVCIPAQVAGSCDSRSRSANWKPSLRFSIAWMRPEKLTTLFSRALILQTSF